MSSRFNETYFMARRDGYSNYLEHAQSWIQKEFYEKFIKRHQFKPTDRILELGAGIGYFGKIGGVNGLDILCTDDAQWCYDNKVYGQFLKREALEFMWTEGSDAYDYIVSFGFLECLNDDQLSNLIDGMKRVGKNQIHCVHLKGNSINVKTMGEWQALFGASAVIEKNG